MLKATVSGSFHRHMSPIYTAVSELRMLGVHVLSPADPRVVDHEGEFLFVASDTVRSLKMVQDRHFQAIKASDFLWVVCPDGYLGPSTSSEIGAAYVSGTPIYSDYPPSDTTIRHYVQIVSSVTDVMKQFGIAQQISRPHNNHFLLDPVSAVDSAISAFDDLRSFLCKQSTREMHGAPAERQLARVKSHLASLHWMNSD